MDGFACIFVVLIANFCTFNVYGFGGLQTDISKSDLRTLKASDFAINILTSNTSAGLPCARAWTLDRVHKQIVAGTSYKMTFHLMPHKCPKSTDNYVSGSKMVCHVTVWERLWNLLNPYSVTHYECRPFYQRVTEKYSTKEMDMFKKFTTTYNKKYVNRREYIKRFGIFLDNMKKVNKLQETERGTAVYGATQFADLTAEEFRRYHLGLNPAMKASNRRAKLAETPSVELPSSFDWRDHNAVTPVKNQGMCGSCWAFSVTGNVEGQWAVKHSSLLSFSEQELVDCDKIDQGCNGGYMTNAYEQIMSLGGLESETDYPYKGVGDKCKLSPSKVEVTLSSYVNISQNETEMAQWLSVNGPISIGINANAMQFYFGGVSHPWKFLCNPQSIDHGVLIVGYGASSYPLFNKSLPYWIVKNSWGDSWGEKGYYRVYRGDGTCGVNLMASSAVVN
ncbi:hypothetical protein CHUAL_013955 [Chamberlinius hualienensis]